MMVYDTLVSIELRYDIPLNTKLVISGTFSSQSLGLVWKQYTDNQETGQQGTLVAALNKREINR